jgi:hypothetical protein
MIKWTIIPDALSPDNEDIGSAILEIDSQNQ